MSAREEIKGKRILIVDDEKDVLDTLTSLLEVCKIDTALSFDQARMLLERNDYDVVILDIMGVEGFDLLKIARRRNIPALMFTAHGLSELNLRKSASEGAAYYAPKEEINQIDVFLADVILAKRKKESAWGKVFERLGAYYDRKFGGSDWRTKEKVFWEGKIRNFPEYDLLGKKTEVK